MRPGRYRFFVRMANPASSSVPRRVIDELYALQTALFHIKHLDLNNGNGVEQVAFFNIVTFRAEIRGHTTSFQILMLSTHMASPTIQGREYNMQGSLQ